MSKEKIQNASIIPKIYFALHMTEGVAHYRPDNEKEYTIFIGENTIKKMDSSFIGRPVYVDHVDDVDMEKLQEEADGYVVESFFNKSDGKHWAKMIVVSDKGHEAIRNGWRVSNAYLVHDYAGGGMWHGVEYSKEVIGGEYEHLAIVQSPRYDESMVLSPEDFRAYNKEKEEDLKINNSLKNKKQKKGEGIMGKFNLFKRTRVENESELKLEELVITLPKSGKEVSFEKLVNMAEEEKKEENSEDEDKGGTEKIKVGDEELTLNELKSKYMNFKKKKNEEDKEENSEDEEVANKKKNSKKKKNEDKEDKEENEEDKEENEEDKEENECDKEENEEDKEENEGDEEENEEEELKNKKSRKRKKNSSDNIDKIKNAEKNFNGGEVVLDLSSDKIARGKARYGSK